MSRPTDDDYLLLIGHLAYEVSYLEGLVVFDLDRAGLHPDPIDIFELGGLTTSQIRDRLRGAISSAGTKQIGDWLRISADALDDVLHRRNAVLHARPATDEHGKARLLRDRVRKGEREWFWITEDYLRESIEFVRERIRLVSAARLEQGAAPVDEPSTTPPT